MNDHRAARHVDHLRCVVVFFFKKKKSRRFWVFVEEWHVKRKHTFAASHVWHSACHFRLPAGVLLHSLHVLYLSKPYTHILFPPDARRLCSKTGAITTPPPLRDPSSLAISRHSAFRPSSSGVLQKKVSAAAEACSRRCASDASNENMDSVR